MLDAAKVVRCTKCFRLLAKRLAMHVGNENTYVLELKHKGLHATTPMAVIKCVGCQSWFRISGPNGIEEKIVNG